MNRSRLGILAFVFACYLLQPCITYASEEKYLITAFELNQLESNLKQLQKINRDSQTELIMLKTELEKSRNELTSARKESELLKTELNILKINSQTQMDLLQSANTSLKIYEAEEKAKLKASKRQSTLAYGLSAVLLYALLKK